jgi:polyisoprenoid-binding protein YceI
MKVLTLSVLAFSLFLAGCEDPSVNRAQATVSNSADATNSNSSTVANANTRTVTPAKGDALAITPENSKIEWIGSKVTGKHDGGFRQFTGTIDLVNAKAEESTVSVEIDTASIYSDNADLTEHLKSADFFDVEKYPKASFRSSKIVADPAKGADIYNVTGDLKLHGVTKSVAFPATIKVSDADVMVNADFSINRKDFEINYAGMANDLIRDGVVMKLELKTPRK